MRANIAARSRCKWTMGKDQELLEAARSGNVTVVEKILGQRAKRSGPLARWVSPELGLTTSASLVAFPRYRGHFLIPSSRSTDPIDDLTTDRSLRPSTRATDVVSRIPLSNHTLCSFRHTPIRVSPIRLPQGFLAATADEGFAIFSAAAAADEETHANGIKRTPTMNEHRRSLLFFSALFCHDDASYDNSFTLDRTYRCRRSINPWLSRLTARPGFLPLALPLITRIILLAFAPSFRSRTRPRIEIPISILGVD